MKTKHILLLLGNPDKSGLGGKLTDAYEKSATEAGHTVTRFNIGEMQFDPILHNGYRAIQALEPDLVRFQEVLKAADHFVIVHPIWFYGMPGILKCLFDRAWLPGSAFRYIKMKDGTRTMFWHRLYRGKTARIIVTGGAPSLVTRLLPGSVTTQLKWGILWFAGFSTSVTWFGSVEGANESRTRSFVSAISRLGTFAK